MKGKCKQCGFCCVYADIRLGEVTKENEEAMKDQAKWLANHRVDAFIVNKDDKQYLVLRLPNACVYLSSDRKTGKYLCSDYANRPQTCRNWVCDLMRGK